MNEAALQRVLLARLNEIPGVWARRQNTGVGRAGQRVVRFGEPGQGDILCVIHGLHLEIECKSEDGRQSDDQRAYQARLEQAGGLYILARDVDSTVARVRLLAERVAGLRILGAKP